MNVQGNRELQQNLLPADEDTQQPELELPIGFKRNGFWHVRGERKAGTLRCKGYGKPTAYFLFTHPSGEEPFNEPTEVRFESLDGLAVKGFVVECTNHKDAGEAGICSEYDSSGLRCKRRRYWKTYCKEHTVAMGYEITDDKICAGQKQNGGACGNKAKVAGYCAQHGGGMAPREQRTRLYEFPVVITEIPRGVIEL